jgi:hypothetical protein
LDSIDEVSQPSSLTIGADGLPLISYSDVPDGVKVFHCANTLCADYFRRR